MPLQAKSVNNTGDCCSCEEQTAPCNCGAGATVPVVCRSKSGLAQKCGHPEYTATPNKFYKLKTTSGSMRVTDHPDSGCGGMKAFYSGAGTGGCVGAAGGLTFGPGEDLGSHIRYHISVTGLGFGDVPNRMIISGSGVFWQSGQTIDLEKGSVAGVQIVQWCPSSGGWIGLTMNPADSSIKVGTAASNENEDEWVRTGDYRDGLPSSCVPVNLDESTRYYNGGGVTWPFVATPPEEAYPGLATTATASPTVRTTTGDEECIGPSGGRYRRAEGTITEELTQEDSSDDAVQRTIGSLEWECADPDSCCETFRIPGTAGSLAFAYAQVMVPLTGLTGGHTYRATIRIGEKPVGISGRYVFYGETIIIEFTAAGETHDTPWQDVPVADDVQYKALYAVLEDIT